MSKVRAIIQSVMRRLTGGEAVKERSQEWPSSMEGMRKWSLLDLSWIGIHVVQCRGSADEGPEGLFDHRWSLLRIRLVGSVSEAYLDQEMALRIREVRRLQLVRSKEFIGRPVSPHGAWVLLIRGRATKRAGKLGVIVDGQASYDEQVRAPEAHRGRQRTIVVQDDLSA